MPGRTEPGERKPDPDPEARKSSGPSSAEASFTHLGKPYLFDVASRDREVIDTAAPALAGAG